MKAARPPGVWSDVEYRRAYAREWARRHRAGQGSVNSRYIAAPLAPELEADRDHRAKLAPSSLTAALCGDPLPGYSALDRRGR